MVHTYTKLQMADKKTPVENVCLAKIQQFRFIHLNKSKKRRSAQFCKKATEITDNSAKLRNIRSGNRKIANISRKSDARVYIFTESPRILRTNHRKSGLVMNASALPISIVFDIK